MTDKKLPYFGKEIRVRCKVCSHVIRMPRSIMSDDIGGCEMVFLICPKCGVLIVRHGFEFHYN